MQGYQQEELSTMKIHIFSFLKKRVILRQNFI